MNFLKFSVNHFALFTSSTWKCTALMQNSLIFAANKTDLAIESNSNDTRALRRFPIPW